MIGARGADPTKQYYKPAPPLAATATIEKDLQELDRPLATPVCIDNLTFISDVSIPDGTEVQANATLDKRWEVKNSGNCNWDEHYRLRLIAGPAMDAVQEQALYPARSGGQVICRSSFGHLPSQAVSAQPGRHTILMGSPLGIRCSLILW